MAPIDFRHWNNFCDLAFKFVQERIVIVEPVSHKHLSSRWSDGHPRPSGRAERPPLQPEPSGFIENSRSGSSKLSFSQVVRDNLALNSSASAESHVSKSESGFSRAVVAGLRKTRAGPRSSASMAR